MKRIAVAAMVIVGLALGGDAQAVTCSPGMSDLNRYFTHPSVQEVPARVYAGWNTDDRLTTPPQYLLVGVRDRDHGWRVQVVATTDGVSVDGDHVATDTGWQASLRANGSVHVCVHAAGRTVDERR